MTPIEIIPGTDQQYFVVNWMLNDRCTYACSYCPPTNHAGDDNWLKLDDVLRTVFQIKNQISLKGMKPQILLTGGEPTVWKDFRSFVEHLQQEEWLVDLCTNLSRTLDWWKTVGVRWNKLACSLHTEFVDIDEFIKKCIYLTERCNSLSVRVMLHTKPDLFRKALEYGELVRKHCPNAFVEWIPIQLEFGESVIPLNPYSEDQLKIIQTLRAGRLKPIKVENFNSKNVIWNNGSKTFLIGSEFVKNGLNKFQGWNCNAGIDGVFIDSKGTIFRGTCHQGGKIGHIFDPIINIPTSPIICQLKTCGCITDVNYPKQKIKND